MMLKRHYEAASLQTFLGAKAQGIKDPPAPRITHHTVENTGLNPEQNWDDQWVEKGAAAGWVTISGDRLELKTDSEPLRYTILRTPGYYCKSTGDAIAMPLAAWLRFRLASDSSESRPIALDWLKAHGKQLDDYEITCAYHCRLDAEQHEHWRAVRHPVNGNIIPAHKLPQEA
jgi:hypothetical protein